jgi:squalene-associated FAD-dependent desaturase
LYEAAGFAGGRCRSYYDAFIDLTIDNGNHLLLSGNRAALDYLRRIGGLRGVTVAKRAEFPFVDLASGERWTLRPNDGRVPWWILDGRRRVPGTRAPDYFAPTKILRAPPGAAVGDVAMCDGALYERLLRPVLLAALNTEPREADAQLAAQVLRETLGAGGLACRPIVATGGLSAAFIEPALQFLRDRGVPVSFNRPLKEVGLSGDAVDRLLIGDVAVTVGAEDQVILALPAVVARALMPRLPAPEVFHAIVNAHFRVAPPPAQPLMLGVLNATTEWLFAYPDRLSVTISCADRLMTEPRQQLAERIWGEVSALAGLPAALPRWQIVRERRATFAATPAQAAKRPPARTHFCNLFLAGDWTRTGLPATIEGSVRSGYAAAEAVMQAADPAEFPRRVA